MGKSVRGKFSVFFRSKGSAIDSDVVPFSALDQQSGRSRKNRYVTMNARVSQPLERAQTSFSAAANLSRKVELFVGVRLEWLTPA